MNPAAYCEDRAAPAGSALYYSVRHLRARTRAAVIALHTLRLELESALSRAGEPAPGLRQLAWWAEEIQAAAAGAGRHPVSAALAGTPAALDWTSAARAMLAAAQQAVADGGFATFAEVRRYAIDFTGPALAFEAAAAGGDPATVARARALAPGLTMSDALAPAGGRPLGGAWTFPGEVVARCGVRDGDLDAAVTSEPLRALVRTYAERARAELSGALEHGAGSHTSGVDARARMAIAGLDALARADFAVLERRVGITPLRKLWIAWSTLRSASRGIG